MPVDPAWLARLLGCQRVVLSPRQAMKVNGRDALQRQHDCLAGQKPAGVELYVVRIVWRESIDIGNVDLVGNVYAVASLSYAYQSASSFHCLDERRHALLRHDPFQGPYSNPIVRGGEVQIGGPRGRSFQAGQPMHQPGRVAMRERVEQQRRQAELIDELRFVAVAKIADVFPVPGGP